MHHNTEYSTQRVLKTLTAVSQIAEILLRSDKLDIVVPEILKKLGKAADVSRVYIYKKINEENSDIYVRQVYEWLTTSSEIPVTSTESKDVPMIQSGYKRWLEEFKKNKAVNGDVSDFPISEQEMLKVQMIYSICVVPIIVENNFWGFIGFDQCFKKRSWGTAEIDGLRTAANILGAFFKLKNSEHALKESETLFKSIFNNVSVGLYRTTLDGKILMCNPALVKKLGFDSYEDIASQNLNERSKKNEFHRDAFLQLMAEKGEIYGYETIWKKKDGSLIHIRENSRAVKDSEGKILYFEGSVEDITSQKEMEDQLIKTQKLESVGLLAGGIAHDFNNLLTGILGNIALAKVDIDSVSEAYYALNEAEMASMHAKELTRQLLTFANGGLPVRKTTDLGQLLKDSTNLVIKNKNIRPIYKIEKNLPHIQVDKGQIRQVVYNLVINAEQSMPNGGELLISAKKYNNIDNSVPTLTSGEYIQVKISDEGVGIPEKIISKVFDPYYTTKQIGSGLGLATAYAIIKKHSGNISLESVLGEGTTAVFYLPLTTVASQKTQPQPDKSKPYNLTKRKVLLMDDEEFIRNLASRVLTKAGFDVTVVNNGEDVLLKYKKLMDAPYCYDVVVLDLVVTGGMGGQDTLRHLKQLDPNAKVIVCSGYSNDPVISHYKKYGFDGIVAKPYAPEDLVKAVKEIIN